MSKLLFIYKGRYQVRDPGVIETLSAMARRAGHEAGLLYDRDLFGASDNVLSLPRLNRLLFPAGRFAGRAARSGAAWAVLLANPGNRAWIESFLLSLRGAGFGGRIAVLCGAGAGFRPGCDAALYGEPESVFGAFLAALAAGGVPASLEAAGPADLDALPLPDKSLFGPYEDPACSYLLYAGKGCRGACSYCEEGLAGPGGGAGLVRMRSPRRVAEELLAAKRRHGLREVIFKDSVFTASRPWLEEFLALYRREIGVPFKCFGRADAFDRATAELLLGGGCYCVEFGLQTCNEEIRTRVLRRPETLGQLRAALAACDEAGLPYDLDYIFGLPGESAADHAAAARAFASCRRLNRVKCHNLVYYPGLPITEQDRKSVV